MHLLRITQPHPCLARIQVWYETSFPASERRSFDQVIELLACPDTHLCALVAEDQPVGFIIYWHWSDTSVLFIEHLAVDPDLRGQRFGQQALRHVLALDFAHILLEAECPTDAISQRRIRFYERQGFSINPFPYAQPPYRRGDPAIPMTLLSIPAIRQREEFDRFSELIQERIYERFYG
ncbi:GNAT family N-acetyltransferase [Spirosoma areae]